MFYEFYIQTKQRYELVDITEKVEKVVKESNIKEGWVLVFVSHSTAAIVLTENEEGLKKDWLNFLKTTVAGFDFQHNRIDDNADSHILSGLIGQGRILPVKDGQMVRGTWQNIFLIELDGPRSRRVVVEIK